MGFDSFFNGILSTFGIDKLPSTWAIVIIMLMVTLVIKFLTDYYLKTEVGLALRATGDNQRMIRRFAADTDTTIDVGSGLSNTIFAIYRALITLHRYLASI